MKNSIPKQTLPAELNKLMKLWRMELIPMPQEYIAFHKTLAENRLEAHKETFRIRVLYTEMVSDGWYDGMMGLRAVVETPSGNIKDLRYCDSNQEFMVKFPNHGGQGMLFDKDLE
jgi:hypothetical protein